MGLLYNDMYLCNEYKNPDYQKNIHTHQKNGSQEMTAGSAQTLMIGTDKK